MQSQSQLHFFDNAPVPMFLLNASGDVIHTNRACEGLFRYSSREWALDDIMSTPVWQESSTYFNASQEPREKLSPYTRLVRFADNRKLYVLKMSIADTKPSYTYIAALTPYQNDDSVNEALLNRLPMGMVRIDASGQFINANQAFLRLLGYEEEEALLKQTEFDVTFEADANREKPLRAGLELGCSAQYRLDKRYVHKKGHHIWARTFVSCVTCQITQQTQFLIAVFDIHEEKQLHEVIATSERRFRAIAENVSSVVWISGPDPMRLYYVNRCFNTVWEERVEALYGDAKAFLDRVHPADRDLVARTRFCDSHDSWRINYRLLFPDGRIKHIRDSGNSVFDGNGDLIYRVGTQTDITAEVDQRDSVVVMAKKLRELVEYDTLTGIKSRHAIISDVRDTYQEFTVTGDPSVLVYIDADGFKAINDTYGHEIGDKVLVCIAEHLTRNIRESDVAGRIGGDEFVVLLRHTAQSEIPQILERLGRDIECEYLPPNMRVAISLGAKELTPDVLSSEQWLSDADKTMYLNKRERKMSHTNHAVSG